ncbi:unnamed protein product, partial [Heterotrigona itama]
RKYFDAFVTSHEFPRVNKSPGIFSQRGLICGASSYVCGSQQGKEGEC